jgi:hypothetical protein
MPRGAVNRLMFVPSIAEQPTLDPHVAPGNAGA